MMPRAHIPAFQVARRWRFPIHGALGLLTPAWSFRLSPHR